MYVTHIRIKVLCFLCIDVCVCVCLCSALITLSYSPENYLFSTSGDWDGSLYPPGGVFPGDLLFLSRWTCYDEQQHVSRPQVSTISPPPVSVHWGRIQDTRKEKKTVWSRSQCERKSCIFIGLTTKTSFKLLNYPFSCSHQIKTVRTLKLQPSVFFATSYGPEQ